MNKLDRLLWHPVAPILTILWLIHSTYRLGSLSTTSILGFVTCGVWLLISIIKIKKEKNVERASLNAERNSNFSDSENIQESFVRFFSRLLLEGAQKSIGLKKSPIRQDSSGMISVGDVIHQPWKPKFYIANKYTQSQERRDGIDIVIGKNGALIYEYSSDIRERPLNIKKYDQLTEAVSYLVERQMSTATYQSMSKDKKYRHKPGIKTYEESQAWMELHNKHRERIEKRLESYLKNPFPKILNWNVHKLCSVSV